MHEVATPYSVFLKAMVWKFLVYYGREETFVAGIVGHFLECLRLAALQEAFELSPVIVVVVRWIRHAWVGAL